MTMVKLRVHTVFTAEIQNGGERILKSYIQSTTAICVYNSSTRGTRGSRRVGWRRGRRGRRTGLLG